MKPAEAQQAAPGFQNPKASFWRRVGFILRILLALAFLGLCVAWLSGFAGHSLDQALADKQDYKAALQIGGNGPPDFVVTVLRKDLWPVQRRTGFRARIDIAYFNLQQRLGIRYPARTWIGVFTNQVTNQEWRVYDGLGQCTQITGKRYLVAREGMQRTVAFGTNAPPTVIIRGNAMVNGVQWVAAFEQTLRTKGWVLIPAWGGVKVVPKDRLEDYKKAGLVK